MLELMDADPNFNVRIISEPILEKLMIDRSLNEEEAADLFYTSETFGKLADESTLLHQKPWADVYEMLKAELKYHPLTQPAARLARLTCAMLDAFRVCSRSERMS